jgi:uncharacterized protein YoxC
MKKMIALLGVLVLFLGGAVAYKNGNAIISQDIFYMASHSEYFSGETGQVIARLLDYQGSPITVQNCTVDIYYPDKTLFVANGVTNDSLQTTTGSHFYNFVVPSTEGVYQYIATCHYSPNKVSTVASSFHVSPALNLIKVLNSTEAQIFANTEIIKTNLTSISADTNYIRANMLTDLAFSNNMSVVISNQNTIIEKEGQILTNITAVQQFCDSPETIGSSLCLYTTEIRDKVTDINTTLQSFVNSQNAILNEINQTTHSTYDYMTGTLATNINNIFGVVQDNYNTLVIINGTVTTMNSNINTININTQSILTNTNDINNTVNTIKTNQEEQVYMEVTS